jgi:Flagellar P-ring protein
MEVYVMKGLGIAAVVCAAILGIGCSPADKPTAPPQPYVDQGYKPGLPSFMRGTVDERTDMGNTDPYPVSGYSLVVNLLSTGDNTSIPTFVRQALIKRMALSGFGQEADPRFTHIQPEDVLRDKRVAVVRVIGMLPVGVRSGQQFDLIVQAMPRSRTTSLAHGHLYNTELRNRGMEEGGMTGMILAYADAGDVMVNPVYALEGASQTYPGVNTAQVEASLRTGMVLRGGRATEDRPIFLQLRVPQASISRAIENRVNIRFPAAEEDRPAAAAQDEGLVELYVPLSFNGEWKHFAEVVNHLYLNDSPDVAAQKTHLLMDEAHRPGAKLEDISYCLEGLGPSVVPIYQSMMDDPDPGVAYCAARAAVFCGEPSALEALTQMATDPTHPFQLAAVHTLGELPALPSIDKRLEVLLGSDQTLVRIEAYKILAAHADRRIITEDIDGRFKLDIVDYDGPPLVYAARSGEARLAVFGRTTSLTPPVVFAAVHDRLTISSDDLGRTVTIFYRDPHGEEPIQVVSGLTLPEIVSRLGGKAAPDAEHLDFSYADVVAIVQGLVGAHLVTGEGANGQVAEAPFVLDQPAALTDALVSAALNARPQADPIHARRPAGTAAPQDSNTSGVDVPSFSQTPPSNSTPSFGNP